MATRSTSKSGLIQKIVSNTKLPSRNVFLRSFFGIFIIDCKLWIKSLHAVSVFNMKNLEKKAHIKHENDMYKVNELWWEYK